jgi:hypothetical protein
MVSMLGTFMPGLPECFKQKFFTNNVTYHACHHQPHAKMCIEHVSTHVRTEALSHNM